MKNVDLIIVKTDLRGLFQPKHVDTSLRQALCGHYPDVPYVRTQVPTPGNT